MRTSSILISGAVASVAVASSAFGQAVSYSTNFESFNLGAIAGQQGWSSSSPSFVANVTDAAAYSGSQSLLRGSSFGSGSFGNQPYSPALAVGVGESTAVGVSWGYNTITASVRFRAVSSVADNSYVQMALTDLSGSRMWNVWFQNLAGGVSVQGYGVNAAGNLFEQQFNVTGLSRTDWNMLTVTTTFVNGSFNDVVSYSLNGGPAVLGTSWEQYYRLNPEQSGNGNQLFAVNSLLFRTPSSIAGSQGFYFDDLSYTAIPAPGALALLGAAGLVGSRRRRS